MADDLVVNGNLGVGGDFSVQGINARYNGNIFAFGVIEAASGLKCGQLNIREVRSTSQAPVVFRTPIEIKSAPNSSTPGNVNIDGNVSAVGEIEALSGLKATQLRVFQILPTTSGPIHVRAALDVVGPVTATDATLSGTLNARDVNVTGDIRLVNADCAEEFALERCATVEPGTVMVLGESGGLRPSDVAYDRRVAGVVSGGGDYRPGIILGEGSGGGAPVALALIGRVACRVDATRKPVAVGDLLTTSDLPGHAMKASDPARAFGAVIGKALAPLEGGTGLVPILVALT